MNKFLKQGKLNKIILSGLFAISLVACSQSAKTQMVEQIENTANLSETSIVAASPNQARIDEMAPDFTGVDSNGVSHQLSDFRGKVVVLEWTNHQCPFVAKHYGTSNMQNLQKEATSKEVVWLSIISSAPNTQGYVSGNKANQLTKSRNAGPTAVILDPEGSIGSLYNARTTPHMYVIDADGVLRYMGAIDNKPSTNAADVKTANNYVSAAIDSILKNRPVETTVTQPYGCSVIYKS